MIKLTVLEWRDLAAVLDAILPKNHSTTAEARKCIGAVEQIRKEIQTRSDELDSLLREAQVIMTPYQEKLKALEEKPENDKKRKKIQDEANLALEDVNKRYSDALTAASDEKVEIKLDENYKSYIKSVWEASIRPMYKDTKTMVRIADTLGI